MTEPLPGDKAAAAEEMAAPSDERAVPPDPARMFFDLLAVTHLTAPDEVGRVLAENAAAIEAEDVVLYLLDYGQAALVPVPSPTAAGRAVLRVDGTVGGRAFTSLRLQDTETGEAGRRRLWLPVVDGTDRIGVMEMTLPAPAGYIEPEMVSYCVRYAHLAAQMVVSKGLYGDAFELVRRRQVMSVAAEVQYKLLPPMTFADPRFSIAAALEPAYNAGGDSVDYALNGSTLHLAVFDAMGHGLPAALTASVAVSAYRNSRRLLLDLVGTYAAIDDTLTGEFGGDRYCTAVLARLNVETGSFTWVSAGHPPPLLLRGGKFVTLLDTEPSTPLGVPFDEPPVSPARTSLEPGDRILLYTDGLTEARTAGGDFFTTERLGDFLVRQVAAGLPAPETMRRVRRAVLTYQDNQLQDDATALLVEWSREAAQALLPQPPQTTSP